MSNPDPNIVQEIAEEIDAPGFIEGLHGGGERVDIPDPSISSFDSEELDFGLSSSHRRRMKTVRKVERRLKRQEGLKWYELAGSYLDHNKADLIRERSGMPAGFELAMPMQRTELTVLPRDTIPFTWTR